MGECPEGKRSQTTKMSGHRTQKSAAEQGRNEVTAVAGDSVGKTMTGRGTQQNDPNSQCLLHT